MTKNLKCSEFDPKMENIELEAHNQADNLGSLAIAINGNMPQTSNDAPMVEANAKLNFDDVSSMSDAEIHQFRDDRGFSLLMLASEVGRLDIVSLLIDRGDEVNIEVKDKSAVSLAFNGRHYKIVLALLKANTKFPSNYDNEVASEELKNFVSLSKRMHEKIRDMKEVDVVEVKMFLKSNIDANPSLRYFYDPFENLSLLKRAILCKKFGIYKFLITLNIFLAPHESMDEINANLTDDEREELSEINYKISPNLMTEPMMILMRNCKLSPDSPKEREAEFMFYIRQAFDDLFAIPLIAIVLKIVAASRNFKLIFDFKRDSVSFLDPSSEPFVNGLMYSTGKIYIGAKDLLYTESIKNVVAVIAHELCHYAMFLVFDNFAKPFKKYDGKASGQFDRISDECENFKGTEHVIDLVYDCYEKEMQHAELIVRVPHMTTLYWNEPEILNQRRRIFQNLFNYFEQTCVPKMEKELPKIERKFCPIKNVEKKVQKQKYLNIFLIISLISSVLTVYCFLLPVSWSDLNENEKIIVKNSIVDFYNDEVKFGELFANDSEVYSLLTSEQIINALNNNSRKINEAFKLTLHNHVHLIWHNMSRTLKDNFLTRKVDFQGQNVSIDEITNDLALNHLNWDQIKEIFAKSSFKVSKTLDPKVKVYIERFFIKNNLKVWSENFYNFQMADCPHRDESSLTFSPCYKYQTELIQYYKDNKIDTKNPVVKTFEDIAREIKSSKIFLLTNAAGEGKSTTFRALNLNFKEKFPSSWVQYIAMKKYIEVYEIGQILNFQDFDVLVNFLGQKLLNLNSFELEIFKKIFNAGNFIFLWDGVDEVAPRYKRLFIALAESIFRSGNCQLFSSRPGYLENFEAKFNTSAHKLIPFSKLDRFEFLVKTIAQNKKFNESGNDVFNLLKTFFNQSYDELSGSKYFAPLTKAQRIFEFTENPINRFQDRFVSNPLLISMISEISCDDSFIVEKSFNTFELFEIFIRQKLKLIHSKGSSVQNIADGIILSSSLNIWKVHQFFALDLIISEFYTDHYFFKNFNIDYSATKVESSLQKFQPDEISSFGILQVYSKERFEFAHRTFAEFFVTQFIKDEIFSFNKIDLSESVDKWKILALFEILVERPSKFPVVKSFLLDASKLPKFDLRFFKYWNEKENLNQRISNDTKMLQVIQFSDYFGMQNYDFDFEPERFTCTPILDSDGSELRNLSKIEEVYGRDFLKSILTYKKVRKYEPPFLCSLWNKCEDFSLQFLKAAGGVLNQTEILSLIIESKAWDENAFMLSAKRRSLEFVKLFWQFIEKFLSKDNQRKVLNQEDSKSWTVLQYSAENKDPNVMLFLQSVYEKLYDKEEN